MGKNLYEVLELSRLAGPEAIEGAYQRLCEKHAALQDQNPDDVDNQNTAKAVREAYRVLTHPARKERYDTYLDSLEPLPTPIEVKPFWTPTKLALGIALVVLSALGYSNYRLAAAEKARLLVAEERAKEEARAEAERQIAEQEKADLEQRHLYEQSKREMLAKFETERARMEGQQIIRQEIQAEDRANQYSLRLTQQAASASQRQSMVERQRFEYQRQQEEQQRRAEQARQQWLQYQQPRYQAAAPDPREQERLRNEAKLNAMKAAQ